MKKLFIVTVLYIIYSKVCVLVGMLYLQAGQSVLIFMKMLLLKIGISTAQ